MTVSNDVSSISYNTFGIEVNISQLIEINEKSDLFLLGDRLKKDKFHILGGGSNILLTGDPDRSVLLVNTKGIELIKESEAYILVRFQAGENWHDAVLWAVHNNYGGIENLSLIPGKCGAAPMQNIGAYGVEIKDVLHSVSAYKISNGLEYTFHREECGFGYRTSNFKTRWKDDFIITDVVIRLTKEGHHKHNISYGAISTELQKSDIAKPNIRHISDTVISIRQSKLPNPKEVGNAGSFFKNPVVAIARYKNLISQFPELPSYPVDKDFYKLPAAWLIDQCGWKGKIVGQTGTYKNQALVLVNHGRATGAEIFELSEEIKASVTDRFGIELEREVNVW